MSNSPIHRSRSRSPSYSRYYGHSNSNSSNSNNIGEDSNKTNLYVSGLSLRLNDEDLERKFSTYGKVVGCQIMRDPHGGVSRGFGFVTMSNSEEAATAISRMDKHELEGKVISVEFARRGRARTPTPGSYKGKGSINTRGYPGGGPMGGYQHGSGYGGGYQQGGAPSGYGGRRYPPSNTGYAPSGHSTYGGYSSGGHSGGRYESYRPREREREPYRDDPRMSSIGGSGGYRGSGGSDGNMMMGQHHSPYEHSRSGALIPGSISNPPYEPRERFDPMGPMSGPMGAPMNGPIGSVGSSGPNYQYQPMSLANQNPQHIEQFDRYTRPDRQRMASPPPPHYR